MKGAQTIRFGGLDIAFDERVLEPRPWTFMQAEWAVELEPTLPSGAFLELGCGAGHIGLAAVAGNVRELVQLDSASPACELALQNAERAGVAERVTVRCGAFDETLASSERFALVIADPPYVPTGETWRYPDDPPEAIDGGPDGLDEIRSSLRVAGAHVMPGGAVLLQTWGEAQAAATSPFATEAGLVLEAVRVHDAHRAVALLRPRS